MNGMCVFLLCSVEIFQILNVSGMERVCNSCHSGKQRSVFDPIENV